MASRNSNCASTMRRPDRETLETLAGEYVLGTLAGPARARFERWIEEDAEIRSMVEAWEGRLATMAEDVPEKAPSPALWQAISQELGHKTAETAKPVKVTRRQFWFGFGSAAATASVLGGVFGLVAWPQSSYAFPTHYAVLRNRENKIAWVVAIHQDHGLYQVHDVPDTPDAPHGREDHLWMAYGQQAPMHFGAVEDDARKKLPNAAAKHVDGATFIVTHEAKGASGLPKPTSETVYQGKALHARPN